MSTDLHDLLYFEFIIAQSEIIIFVGSSVRHEAERVQRCIAYDGHQKKQPCSEDDEIARISSLTLKTKPNV